jgi:hypothetical protein
MRKSGPNLLIYIFIIPCSITMQMDLNYQLSNINYKIKDQVRIHCNSYVFHLTSYNNNSHCRFLPRGFKTSFPLDKLGIWWGHLCRWASFSKVGSERDVAPGRDQWRDDGYSMVWRHTVGHILVGGGRGTRPARARQQVDHVPHHRVDAAHHGNRSLIEKEY